MTMVERGTVPALPHRFTQFKITKPLQAVTCLRLLIQQPGCFASTGTHLIHFVRPVKTVVQRGDLKRLEHLSRVHQEDCRHIWLEASMGISTVETKDAQAKVTQFSEPQMLG